MTSPYDGYGGGQQSGYRYGTAANGYGSDGGTREPGGRRKKLAAMAGSLYRAGAAAASEIKEQYNNTRIRNLEPMDPELMSIPGSFPHVRIIHKGEEQMVLFPSYAKRHTRIYGDRDQEHMFNPAQGTEGAMNDNEYWRHEWAKAEDEKAVVDVDVRGWIYMPTRGPMTRKNRMLLGLARRLSGIPAPTLPQDQQTPAGTHEEQERMREERRIAKEAQEIEQKGQGEREVADRGGYSEKPRDGDPDPELDRVRKTRSGTQTPVSPPDSPALIARPSFVASDLSGSELATANANLMARIGPFMTSPLVNLPITIFFYNDEQSQSRTVETNDSGHFHIRAPLDFVPTHVRVLVNENISATLPVQIIEPKGISLISDVDDTIKRSNISFGAREIFRNTFIRDLKDLTIEGVKEWYNSLSKMGVKVHYCSNSPWQLFPVLATFFHIAELPPGSIHLKQYSGMLQGIFEPVAERKKGTLEKILRDFPERRFLLVGDSGEADLEVYTELAVANPGRILAVFIRDVTTPEQSGYFDTGFGLDRSRQNTRTRFEDQQQQQHMQHMQHMQQQQQQQTREQRQANRPEPPPRNASAPPQQQQQQGPVMGTLIDLSDEPDHISPTDTRRPFASTSSKSDTGRTSSGSSSASAADSLTSKKPPPPRPAKPIALRSLPSDVGSGTENINNTRPKTSSGSKSASGGHHPLQQMHNTSQQTTQQKSRNSSSTSLPQTARPKTSGGEKGNGQSPSSSMYFTSNPKPGSGSGTNTPPPPPPPRRRGTPLNTPQPQLPRRTTDTSTISNTHNNLKPNNNHYNEDRDFNPLSNAADDIGATVLTGHGLQNVASGSNNGGGQGASSSYGGGDAATINKKLELWHRRLARAHEILDEQGVPLYTWRKGEDVIKESEGIVREALRGLGGGGGGGGNWGGRGRGK